MGFASIWKHEFICDYRCYILVKKRNARLCLNYITICINKTFSMSFWASSGRDGSIHLSAHGLYKCLALLLKNCAPVLDECILQLCSGH